LVELERRYGPFPTKGKGSDWIGTPWNTTQTKVDYVNWPMLSMEILPSTTGPFPVNETRMWVYQDAGTTDVKLNVTAPASPPSPSSPNSPSSPDAPSTPETPAGSPAGRNATETGDGSKSVAATTAAGPSLLGMVWALASTLMLSLLM
jgi:hypothetical protein